MNTLTDLLLSPPIPDGWLKGLLFASFSLHLLFVLLTLGTALLGVFYLIRIWWADRLEELPWHKAVVRAFLPVSALAVVLGVGPLLLIQVGFTIPFFTATSLFAPFWMLVIPLLILALLSFDVLGHKVDVHHYLHLFFGIVALAALLAVPGIFVLILVTAENSDQWLTIIHNGYQLQGKPAAHWLLRYLHVLGAALVFGGAFHYYFTAHRNPKERELLAQWVSIGLLLQFVLGPALIISLPRPPDGVTTLALVTGIAVGAYLLRMVFTKSGSGQGLPIQRTVPLLMVLLILMLGTRQLLQDRGIVPLIEKVREHAVPYDKTLDDYRKEAVRSYQADLEVVYNRGDVIFSRSCGFCHGESGDGKGAEAGHLMIPVEVISAVRADRAYLRRVIVEGVNGTAMPYFSIFDRGKIEDLIGYLDQTFHVLSTPEPIPVTLSRAALDRAAQTYLETCSTCHGPKGEATPFAESLQPPPPDLRLYSVAPQRAFEVITNGYPGTVMPSFGSLPEDVRWGLVQQTYDRRAAVLSSEREGSFQR